MKRRERTPEEVIERAEERKRMFDVFEQIWRTRAHYSEVSGKWLGNQPLTTMFDHLLEKSVYPQFKYEEENIILVTPDEHDAKTRGWPLPKHKELIEKAKRELLCGNGGIE